MERIKFDNVVKEVKNIEYIEKDEWSISYINKNGLKIEMSSVYDIEDDIVDINGDHPSAGCKYLSVSNNGITITLIQHEGYESSEIEMYSEFGDLVNGSSYIYIYDFDDKGSCFEEFSRLLKQWHHRLI
jgi:hypothetical protein